MRRDKGKLKQSLSASDLLKTIFSFGAYTLTELDIIEAKLAARCGLLAGLGCLTLELNIHSLTTPYCTIIAREEPHSASIFSECLSC